MYLHTGFEISALSLPVDAPAETIWFWLHHYASNQAQRPHDFPRGTWHESVHWCGRWGIKSCNGGCFLHTLIVYTHSVWRKLFITWSFIPGMLFEAFRAATICCWSFNMPFSKWNSFWNSRIHLAACMCFHHFLHVICYRSRLRQRAALIVGQRMKVVATVIRWATIFLQMIVWMKASVWIAPTMQTECSSQRYIFCLPTAQKLIKLLC